MFLKRVVLIALGIVCSVFESGAEARDYRIGTLAYSFAAGGHPNVFVQGPISDHGAWFIDKCNDLGNTVAGLYKNYRNNSYSGLYWFGGVIYVESGERAGNSFAAGIGYEAITVGNLSMGAYAGYAGGTNGQRFGVFDITLAYVFR